MKRLTVLFLMWILLAGCSHVAPTSEVIKRGCGPYPAQYKAMITDFISNQLSSSDAETNMSIIKTPSKIKIDTDYPFIPLFKGQSVWECFIAYDTENSPHLPSDKSFHVAWIRHNRLVAFDYKDIDLGYALKTRFSGKFQPKNEADSQS